MVSHECAVAVGSTLPAGGSDSEGTTPKVRDRSVQHQVQHYANANAIARPRDLLVPAKNVINRKKFYVIFGWINTLICVCKIDGIQTWVLIGELIERLQRRPDLLTDGQQTEDRPVLVLFSLLGLMLDSTCLVTSCLRVTRCDTGILLN